MDSKQRVNIQSQTSYRNIEDVLSRLEEEYITSAARRAIRRHLEIARTGLSREDKIDAMLLIDEVFSKTPSQLKYIDEGSKKKAKTLLGKLALAFKEDTSLTVDSVTDSLCQLNVQSEPDMALRICLREFLIEHSLVPELENKFLELGILQKEIRIASKPEIRLFGELSFLGL